MSTHTLVALVAIAIAIAVAGIAIGVLVAELRHDQPPAPASDVDPCRGLSPDARRILGVPTPGGPR